MKEKARNAKSFKRSLLVLLLCGCASLQVFAQRTVTGVVKDDMGEMGGVTVTVKGTNQKTITNADGEYTLQDVPDEATLVFTAIGKEEQEIAASADRVDATMEEKAVETQVVTIYGQAIEKKSLTGAVGSASGEDLQKRPANNVAEALTGQIAGVSVTTTEGSPDAAIQLLVRGTSSITQNTEPLYIVDGMPVSSIADIPASVIQSIDVLKDASTTAIYGARGANGVVLITTKDANVSDKDDCKKITVDYSGSVGWKWLAKKLPEISSQDFVKWQYERAYLNNGFGRTDAQKNKISSQFYKYYDPNYDANDKGKTTSYADLMNHYAGIESTDWQDEIFGRTGLTVNNSLTISGGSNALNYSLNYSRLDDKAIMQGSNYTKDYLQFKLNAQPHKSVKLGATARYSGIKTIGSGANSISGKDASEARLKQILLYPPFPVNFDENAAEADPDEDGNPTDDAIALLSPDSTIIENYKENSKKTYTFQGFVRWTIIKGLTFEAQGAFDSRIEDTYRYYGATSSQAKKIRATNGERMPSIFNERESYSRYRSTNLLTYKLDRLKNAHSFSVMLGHELLITNYRNEATEVRNVPLNYSYDEANSFTAAGDATIINLTTPPSDRLVSFFGSANYDYKGRYLFSGTLRADGSSKFAKGKQWGYFPALSAGWRISSETFMRWAKPALTDLKLRVTYGTTGNNDIDASQFHQLYYATVDADGNKSIGTGSTKANPDLVWETTVTRGAGLDFALLKDRLSGTVDVYWNTVSDMLMLYPGIPGYKDGQYQNIGSVTNKGVEVTLNGMILQGQDYFLSANVNFAYNKNNVESIEGRDFVLAKSDWGNGDPNSGDFIVQVGNPLGQVYGFVYDGWYKADDFKWSGTKWEMNDAKYNQVRIDEATGFEVFHDGNGNDFVKNDTRLQNSYGPGGMKFKDLNGDGYINEDDKTVIGNTHPKMTGGFNLAAQYKGFDISANFAFVYGIDVYNANELELSQNNKSKFRKISTNLASGSRWTFIDAEGNAVFNDAAKLAEMNANATAPLPTVNSGFIVHSGIIEDGSFLRFSNLTLGYTFPSDWTKKIAISTARLYVTGGNLFCWTKYSGYDPEVSTRRKTPMTPGVDYSAYPKSISLTVGLNLTF